jgi:signal transduction histidine kinase
VDARYAREGAPLAPQRARPAPSDRAPDAPRRCAIKFTAPGGRVAVACAAAGDRVTIRVTDSGIGIPAGELDRIFEPFVQVNASLTRTQEGTGLGLSISRDLARGMGGDLTAESTPGAGSTFTLTLPRG